MLNKDIYFKDPALHKLVNEGVASVNDDQSSAALAVLRYELETFVCDGQYQRGLERILQTFLSNINQSEQPAVWVSGFYGSGKSHLVKMLRALWVDTPFSDGATARSTAALPNEVQALLRELSTAGKRHGGLHAVSGTLGSGAAGSVRLALLSLVFKSVGLPARYPLARFVLWLQKEGIYNEVHRLVTTRGADWQSELDNLYVAEDLHAALQAVRPKAFPNSAMCIETLNNMFPDVKDVSSDEMISAMQQALSRGKQFPLTLIVLDEMQQYIGQDLKRAMDVQEVVETCCKQFAGKLIFVATGQSAMGGTTNMDKLQGRFQVRVELTDVDVDEVVRKVVLAKKASAIQPLNDVLQKNMGEVTRHLDTTRLRHQEIDMQHFAADYPLLPTRRRFWEATLRVLDESGTDSQLRNRLNLMHKAIRSNLDQPLGHVLPADYLYFDAADRLLHASNLAKELHEDTKHWIDSKDEDKRLLSRACGLIFLINKLSDNNKEIGIRATVDVLADLLVEDLSCGSSALRSKLPDLLANCSHIMQVRDEYRIQTTISSAWQTEFKAQQALLKRESHNVDGERNQRLQKAVSEIIRRVVITQGNTKERRTLVTEFGPSLPAEKAAQLAAWVRADWNNDLNSVRSDALAAGSNSPTIFVFIPSLNTDDLRNQIADYLAACNTLERRIVHNDDPEETRAKEAMDTLRQIADGRIKQLLDEMLAEAVVYQGGGTEVLGSDLVDKVSEAGNSAAVRLYPKFHLADTPGWAKVYEKAREGANDALQFVGHNTAPEQHPVCKEIVSYVASGKQGAAIRSHFNAPVYGWSNDVIDGALLALVAAGLLRIQDERGNIIELKTLSRNQMGKATFRQETVVLSTADLIKARQVLRRVGLSVNSEELPNAMHTFLHALENLAAGAGGEPPMPALPDKALLNALRLAAGNEKILLLASRGDDFTAAIEHWQARAEKIATRMPDWHKLQTLIRHASLLPVAVAVQEQAAAISDNRLLLQDPNPMQPLISDLQDCLRQALAEMQERYSNEYAAQCASLTRDPGWQALDDDVQEQLLKQEGLTAPTAASVGTHEDLINVLIHKPLQTWADRTDALAGRFARVRVSAAKASEPQAQVLSVPRQTLHTTKDVELWLEALRAKLLQAVSQGPVVLE